MDKKGNFLTGRRRADGSYAWMIPAYLPPILLDMKWHETERGRIA